jgi:hypothetical protein
MYTVYKIQEHPKNVMPYIGCTSNIDLRMSSFGHNVPKEHIEILWKTDDIIDASIMEQWEQLRLLGKSDNHFYHLEHSLESVDKWKASLRERNESRIWTDESRIRLSEYRTGRMASRETRKKMSIVHLGNRSKTGMTYTPEQKKAISVQFKDITKSRFSCIFCKHETTINQINKHVCSIGA